MCVYKAAEGRVPVSLLDCISVSISRPLSFVFTVRLYYHKCVKY